MKPARMPALMTLEYDEHSRTLPVVSHAFTGRGRCGGARAARSFFERQAGLGLGGYEDVPPRPLAPVVGRGMRKVLLLARGRRGLDAGAGLGTSDVTAPGP